MQLKLFFTRLGLGIKQFFVKAKHALSIGLGRLKKSILSLKWYEWLMIGIMAVVAIYSVVCNHLGYNPVVLSFTNLKESINSLPLTTIEQAKASYYAEPVWLNYIYCIGALVGIMCIFFCAKASISNFIFGLVNTVILILYFGYWSMNGSAYWGTFFLELLVYLPTGIISWIIWARHRDKEQDELTKAKKFTWWQNVILGVGVAGLTVGINAILYGFSGNPTVAKLVGDGWTKINPVLCWFDSAVFAIGLTATFLQMFRFREQYVLWLVQDVIVVTQFTLPIFIETPKGFDLVYWTKKMIYLIMAVIGLINWIKLQKMRNQTNE